MQSIKNLLNNQRFRFFIAIGLAGVIDILAQGKWRHAMWVPFVIAFLTDKEKVLAGGTLVAPVPVITAEAAAAKAALTRNDDTITPLERPPSGPTTAGATGVTGPGPCPPGAPGLPGPSGPSK